MLTLIYGIIILVLSVWPLEMPEESSLPWLDKLIHVVMYGILSCLAAWCPRRSMMMNSILGASLAIVLGLITEYLQGTNLVNRNFEYFDIIANIIGSIIGATIYLMKKQ